MENISHKNKKLYIFIIITVLIIIISGYSWIGKSAIQKNYIIFQEAQQLEKNKEYSKAIGKYEEAATKGDPASLVALGNIYYYGKIVS